MLKTLKPKQIEATQDKRAVYITGPDSQVFIRAALKAYNRSYTSADIRNVKLNYQRLSYLINEIIALNANVKYDPDFTCSRYQKFGMLVRYGTKDSSLIIQISMFCIYTKKHFFVVRFPSPQNGEALRASKTYLYMQEAIDLANTTEL